MSRRNTLAALAVTVLLTAQALATSNRIFISTTGNNANDCSNPLTPCLDFGGALSQVNAGGEIIADATGPYGPLSITQAVTISGPPGVVIYSGHQVTVNAPGATVVLRGLTIDGNGALENGINVVAVGELYVEGCVIAGFGGTGRSHGNGIYFGSAGNLFVTDTILRGGFVGIWVSPPSAGTAKASVDRCRLEGYVFGMLSDTATVLGATAVGTIRYSVIAGSATAGLDAASGELNVEKCQLANNDFGIISEVGGIVRVSNSTITDNFIGLDTSNGGSIFSRGNNTVEGNATNGTFTGSYSAK